MNHTNLLSQVKVFFPLAILVIVASPCYSGSYYTEASKVKQIDYFQCLPPTQPSYCTSNFPLRPVTSRSFAQLSPRLRPLNVDPYQLTFNSLGLQKNLHQSCKGESLGESKKTSKPERIPLAIHPPQQCMRIEQTVLPFAHAIRPTEQDILLEDGNYTGPPQHVTHANPPSKAAAQGCAYECARDACCSNLLCGCGARFKPGTFLHFCFARDRGGCINDNCLPSYACMCVTASLAITGIVLTALNKT